MNKRKLSVSVIVFVVAIVGLGVVFFAVKSPGEKNESQEIDTAAPRSTIVSLWLDVAGIAEEVQSRAGDRLKDKRQLSVAMDWIDRLDVTEAEIYVHRLDDGTFAPLVTLPDSDGKVWKELSDNPMVAKYLTEKDDAFVPNWDALEGQQDIPASQRDMLIKQIDDQVVLTRKPLMALIENGKYDSGSQFVTRLGTQTKAKDTLGLISMTVPKKFTADWQDKLKKQDAVQNNPTAGRIVDMAGALVSQVGDVFTQTDGLAAAFRFTGDDKRSMSIVQHYRKPATAEDVANVLNASEPDTSDMHDFPAGLVKALQADPLTCKTTHSGQNVGLELSWNEADDQRVMQLLGKATVGYLMAGAMRSGLKPSEGPVTTRYTQTPQLAEDVGEKEGLISRVRKRLQNALFPGDYFDHGDHPHMPLQLDPLLLPNAELCSGKYEILSISSTAGKDIRRRDDKSMHVNRSLGGHTTRLQLPIKKGTKKQKLGECRVKLTLGVPVSLEIFKINADKPAENEQTRADVRVKVEKLEKNIASVKVSGNEGAPHLFAFDKTGQAIASRMSMVNEQGVEARFSGIIDKLWVVVPKEKVRIKQTVDVDLNSGEPPQIPEKPTSDLPVRYARSDSKNYVSLSEKDLKGLAVQWQRYETTRGKSPFAAKRLILVLPEAVPNTDAVWETHWFSKDKPLSVEGDSYRWRAKCFWRPRKKANAATAVFGRVKLRIPTDFQRLTFKKTTDDETLSQTLSDGKQVKMTFKKNTVTYSAAQHNVIDFVAVDTAGHKLKRGNRTSSGRQGRTNYYWGVPAAVKLVLSSRKITRTIPFEIVKQETDKNAFAKFKTRVKKRRPIALLAQKLEQKLRENWLRYGDDLAGHYYLFNDEGTPGKRVPVEVAHSCPDGADRFGYEVKPYLGYHFSFVKFMKDDGKKLPAISKGGEKTFTWQDGKIETKKCWQVPRIIAWPVDASHSTFMQYRNTTYRKNTEGKRPKAVPRHLWDSSWKRVKYVQ